MIPIFEQGHGRGIGLMLNDFLHRMEEICREHLDTGRAKAIAIILRDATNSDLKRILQDQGAYTKLDRLSGDRLSVFFIHTASEAALARFNHTVGASLGVTDARLPAVAFFRTTVEEGDVVGFTDLEIRTLDQANIIHGLQELYDLIENYVSKTVEVTQPARTAAGRVKKVGTFFSLEVLRAALREGLGLLF